MSNKTAAATTVATGATLTEDVTTPPPSYEEHANTTPGALVQSEPQTPAVAATAAATESDVARAASAPVEAAAEPAPLGQTERQGDNTITKPPPVHQPMLPAEAPKASPGAITVTPLPQLTENPAWIDCPYCNRCTKTLVTAEGGSAQCMSAALCCLCCGIITVCIPFLCHWFEDTHIQCSGCRKQVAMIPHDGPIVVYWPQQQGQPPHARQQADAPPPPPPKS